MTPEERAGLRQAIANGSDDMAWPSKTVSELLDDLDRLDAHVAELGDRVMTAPMPPDYLTEIRAADAQFDLKPSAISVYGHRRALLAEVDRLNAVIDAGKCPYTPPCARCQPRTIGTRTHINPAPLVWDEEWQAYVTEQAKDGAP